jgi:PPOX class probable F420-dependent enzyme
VAKQRDAVRMSDAEVAAFLAESRSLNVATLDKDGAPHLTTLWFALSEGRPIFETYRASQKVVNLRRDPRIAVLCEAGETYDQLRGVSITGRAEIVEENPRLEALMRLLVEGNHPGLSEAPLVATTAQMVRKRVVVIVHPDKVMSWDHRKLPPPAGGG